MYVCLCNGISDRQVTELALAGRETAEEVYAELGASPVCGHCLEYAQTLINHAQVGPEAGDGGSPLDVTVS